jgi:hypothetical protein
VKGEIAGILFQESDLQSFRLRLYPGPFELRFRKIHPGDVVTPFGQFNGVAAGTAANVEDAERFVVIKFLFDKVALAEGSGGENFVVVAFSVILK